MPPQPASPQIQGHQKGGIFWTGECVDDILILEPVVNAEGGISNANTGSIAHERLTEAWAKLRQSNVG